MQFGIRARVNFSNTDKIARARRASAIWSLWKISKCLFIPNYMRKIMWLLVSNTRTKLSDKKTDSFVFILPYGVNTLRLQESSFSKHLSSCLYFVACFCFWHYPLNFELKCCCSQQACSPISFFVTFFKVPVNSF